MTDRARERALRLYPRSRGFRGAYVRGAHAHLSGYTIAACPYRREREPTTWRSAWRAAWIRGWLSIP
jgi:hypothetical protein